MDTKKPLREYRTLVILDLPDGTRRIFSADTPHTTDGHRYDFPVWESEIGWSTYANDQSNRPIPMDHVLQVKEAATFRSFAGTLVEGLPWVVYCKAVPDTAGANLAMFTRNELTGVPSGQENWRDSYDARGKYKLANAR